jgi:hypothetical protein
VRLKVAPVAAVALARCGGDDDEYGNEPRPPAPINVTAAIEDERVRVSPESFGSGPVVIIISNQPGSPQTVTFETDEIGGGSGGIRRSTPGDRRPLDPAAEGRPARGHLPAERQ